MSIVIVDSYVKLSETSKYHVDLDGEFHRSLQFNTAAEIFSLEPPKEFQKFP